MMKGVKLCILVALTATFVAGLKNVFEYEMEQLVDDESFVRALWKEELRNPKPVKLQKYGWSDCSGGKGSAFVKNLLIGPDPVYVPGPLDVTAAINISHECITPLKGNVTMKWKKFGRWLEVPCIDNFGTCIYENVCDLLSQITNCPSQLVKIGLDCHCPFKVNMYSLPKTEFDLDASVFPTGDFMIIGNLTFNGAETACLNFNVTFSD